jgi:hypothetical protein
MEEAATKRKPRKLFLFALNQRSVIKRRRIQKERKETVDSFAPRRKKPRWESQRPVLNFAPRGKL